MPAEVTPASVLSALSLGLGAVEALVPVGPWRVAVSAISAVAQLLAELFAKGIEPHEAIAVWRSAQTNKSKVESEIDALIQARAKP